MALDNALNQTLDIAALFNPEVAQAYIDQTAIYQVAFVQEVGNLLNVLGAGQDLEPMLRRAVVLSAGLDLLSAKDLAENYRRNRLIIQGLGYRALPTQTLVLDAAVEPEVGLHQIEINATEETIELANAEEPTFDVSATEIVSVLEGTVLNAGVLTAPEPSELTVTPILEEAELVDSVASKHFIQGAEYTVVPRGHMQKEALVTMAKFFGGVNLDLLVGLNKGQTSQLVNALFVLFKTYPGVQKSRYDERFAQLSAHTLDHASIADLSAAANVSRGAIIGAFNYASTMLRGKVSLNNLRVVILDVMAQNPSDALLITEPGIVITNPVMPAAPTNPTSESIEKAEILQSPSDRALKTLVKFFGETNADLLTGLSVEQITELTEWIMDDTYQNSPKMLPRVPSERINQMLAYFVNNKQWHEQAIALGKSHSAVYVSIHTYAKNLRMRYTDQQLREVIQEQLANIETQPIPTEEAATVLQLPKTFLTEIQTAAVPETEIPVDEIHEGEILLNNETHTQDPFEMLACALKYTDAVRYKILKGVFELSGNQPDRTPAAKAVYEDLKDILDLTSIDPRQRQFTDSIGFRALQLIVQGTSTLEPLSGKSVQSKMGLQLMHAKRKFPDVLHEAVQELGRIRAEALKPGRI